MTKVRKPITFNIGAAGVATDITTFAVLGSGSQILSFAHPFKAGDIPSGSRALITDFSNVPVPNGQSDIRIAHADGSVRHALLCGTLAGGQSYKIRSISGAAGSALSLAGLLAQFPTEVATVTLSGGVAGTLSLRGLLNAATNRASGGLVTVESGSACLGLEVAQDFATHLRVQCYLRWYGGNNLWLDVLFCNGYADLAASGDKSYVAVVTLNGVQTSSTTLSPHYNKSGWHVECSTAGVGTTRGAVDVQHNAAYVISTGAVPNYDLTRPMGGGFLAGVRQSVAPMAIGDNSVSIDDTGAQPGIGLLPQWGAAYFTSGADQRAKRWTLANEDAGMSYGIFWLDSANNGQPVVASTRPTFILNDGTNLPAGYNSGASPYTPAANGLGVEPSAHIPAMGYLGYLLTGSRCYLHQMQAAASLTHMWPSSSLNTSFGGQTIRLWHTQQIRGMAWNYRDTARCAYITPTSDPLSIYWTNLLTGNFANDNALYGPTGTQVNALGVIQNGDGVDNYGTFMHWFYLGTLGHIATELGLGGTNALNVGKFAGKFVAGLLGANDDYPWQLAANSRFACATANNNASVYASFSALATANISGSVLATDMGTIAGTNAAGSGDPNWAAGIRNQINGWQNGTGQAASGESTYYFANLQMAAAYLRALNVAGAYKAWARMQMSGLWPDYSQTPQFSIVPRKISIPLWRRNKTANAAFALTGCRLNSVDPNPVPAGNTGPSAKLVAWGSGSMEYQDSTYRLVWCGGHTDYAGNEVNGWALNQDAPTCVQEIAPTAAGSVTASSASGYYADGRSASSHMYYNAVFLEGQRKAVRLTAQFVYGNPDPTANTVDHYDVVTKTQSTSGQHVNITADTYALPKSVNLANGIVYYVTAAGSFRKYNLVKNTDAQIASVGVLEVERCGAMNPLDGILLVAPGVGTQTSKWTSYNIDTGAETDRTAAINLGTGGQGCLDWDDRNGRWIYIPADCSAVYAISRTFVRTTVVSAGLPGAPSNGLYHKARVAPEQDCLFMVTGYSVDPTVVAFSANP